MNLDRSGMMGDPPTRRRFKSCLPDVTEALVIARGFRRCLDAAEIGDGGANGVQLLRATAMAAMARQHGTGRIYIKWGAFYGATSTAASARLARAGARTGSRAARAERMLRRLMETETQQRLARAMLARGSAPKT